MTAGGEIEERKRRRNLDLIRDGFKIVLERDLKIKRVIDREHRRRDVRRIS